MAIPVALKHRSAYEYAKPVSLGPQTIRLRPAAHCRTPILSYSLILRPDEHHIHWHTDALGNSVARVVIPEKTRELSVEVDLVADLTPINPFEFLIEPAAEHFPFSYSNQVASELQLYRCAAPPGPRLRDYLNRFDFRSRVPTVQFLSDLVSEFAGDIAYLTRQEGGVQSAEETLTKGSGSCRDSTWLLMDILRQLGLAARFVSGYLVQLDSDNTELHAWAEVFLPGAGWVGLDPTSGLWTAHEHIPLACAPEPAQASPISGTVESTEVVFTYSINRRRLDVQVPMETSISDDQWQRIRTLGQQVDRDLANGDVRLTMGGEPTYVGLDEPDSPQWNGAALGDLKRERSVALIRRLRERVAPGALLHFGQGKWYPGEPLPRWALNCYWRADGHPIWINPGLIAPELIDNDGHDYGHTTEDALTFLKTLTRRLQVCESNILPAYEDALYYIWRERKLPVNVDVLESRLSDAREREELARVFTQGLQNPVGYVLPLRRRQHERRVYWSSQLWFLRPQRVHLLQGDSPIGFRLPLDSLPWVAPDLIEYDYELDPFDPRNPLPPKPSSSELFNDPVPEDPLPAEPQCGESAEHVIRPALSVEVRQRRLHVFLPYTTKLPDYLDLVYAIEDTAAHLQWPVWLEGYTPPSDPRLRSFSITPDPGVIEVNLPPAANWDELEQINTAVDEEARACRLTAEKFQYNGKRTSTNGGNHVVIGGPTAGDSPLLRRPDLLCSMVTFWQNHPSLSYLFAGTFIGPTSQYPRVDEARMDTLYELEIAFSQLPQHDCPPWMVDRLFRNLLIDTTGNTHRAEFCIDKLYPPQGQRLGLLELRAFEMAPRVRMQLAQLLLVRALVAAFWNHPYRARLVRWGIRLHDQFLLPYYLEQDLRNVLITLQHYGYEFNPEWYRPQLEFRFPKLGSIVAEGIELELRQALEPWHVLGEEASGGGTVRSVDSSLERMQVKMRGFNEHRYAVVCNGRRLPLRLTDKPGEAVAGVRYRAWLPPSALHPTIPVQSPLQFYIMDTWRNQVVGACEYHVVHPEGKWYDTAPANAAEAASRRAEHFREITAAHAPGQVPATEQNPCFATTLDLRWPAPNQQSRTGLPLPGLDVQ